MSVCSLDAFSPAGSVGPRPESPGPSFDVRDTRARCLRDARHREPCWTALHRARMEEWTADDEGMPAPRGRPAICLVEYLRRLRIRSGGSLVREPAKRGRPSIPLESPLADGRPVPHPEPPRPGRPRKDLHLHHHRPQPQPQPQQQQPQQQPSPVGSPAHYFSRPEPSPTHHPNPVGSPADYFSRLELSPTHYLNPDGTTAKFPDGLTVTRVDPHDEGDDRLSSCSSPPMPPLFTIPPPPPAAIVLSPGMPRQQQYEVFYAEERSPLTMRLSQEHFGLASVGSITVGSPQSPIFSPKGADASPDTELFRTSVKNLIDRLEIEEAETQVYDSQTAALSPVSGADTVPYPTPTFQTLFSDAETEIMDCA